MPTECKIPRFVQFANKVKSAEETNKTPGKSVSLKACCVKIPHKKIGILVRFLITLILSYEDLHDNHFPLCSSSYKVEQNSQFTV